MLAESQWVGGLPVRFDICRASVDASQNRREIFNLKRRIFRFSDLEVKIQIVAERGRKCPAVKDYLKTNLRILLDERLENRS